MKKNSANATLAVIIPACDEEQCIEHVLQELLRTIDTDKFVIAVGVNASTDRTAELARKYPVLVAETAERGYGFGCRAAIDLVANIYPKVEGYIFFAADGANRPRDIARLAHAREDGYGLVLGSRTKRLSNWRTMTLPHVIANFALGTWCGLLTGRWFSDLGPLRFIDRALFDSLALREMTFGWTIEPQIGAAMFGIKSCEITVNERKRFAGRQKVSGVTWSQTLSIGCRIFAAGWRARRRFRKRIVQSAMPPLSTLAQEA